MTKGFKLLLVAEEDPEFRNYIKNIVKDKVGDIDSGILADVVKQSLIESTGKISEKVDEQIKQSVKYIVSAEWGVSSSGVYRTYMSDSDQRHSDALRNIVREEVKLVVKSLLTEDLIASIAREIVADQMNNITAIARIGSKKKSSKETQ
jgi:hypothetical protein